jgi:hypothetical protein
MVRLKGGHYVRRIDAHKPPERDGRNRKVS